MKSRAISSFVSLVAAALALSVTARATYVAVDLGTGPVANDIDQGSLAGWMPFASEFGNRAHAWTGATQGDVTDVHPSFLDTATTAGSSYAAAVSGGLAVGYGVGSPTLNRAAPIAWRNGVASYLDPGFAYYFGQATDTDGIQIVGNVSQQDTKHDIVTGGPSHAVLWDAVTGSATDLSPGNKGYSVFGVGGGVQVGYEQKSKYVEAVLWTGTARSMVNLHDQDYDLSIAYATNGPTQVGILGQDRQFFAEKRGRRVRFYTAVSWHGSADSVSFFDSGAYPDSWAVDVKGDTAVGYGALINYLGVPQTYRALAWVGAGHTRVELHALLQGSFAHSRAVSVDAAGNIVGNATTADGKVHSIVWIKQ
ncbi:MAG: hypothetical protein JST30_02050 [Armatimonadetes bacterium]|nr:hypothetical protein [Armatimonadota bacterium]